MQEDTIIHKMVENVRSGKLPRRQLVKALTAMGISTAGVTAITSSAIVNPARTAPHPGVNVTENEATHLQLHDQHMTNQTQGNLDELHNDYAPHAVVEDNMFSAPIVGRAAIIARKSMGLSAVTNAQITVTNRIAIGNQVTIEWLANGLHTGDLPGLPATGRPYTLRGVTVVVREEGKIVHEALYYDLADLTRQLS